MLFICSSPTPAIRLSRRADDGDHHLVGNVEGLDEDVLTRAQSGRMADEDVGQPVESWVVHGGRTVAGLARSCSTFRSEVSAILTENARGR
jgi:hypothetical protein